MQEAAIKALEEVDSQNYVKLQDYVKKEISKIPVRSEPVNQKDEIEPGIDNSEPIELFPTKSVPVKSSIPTKSAIPEVADAKPKSIIPEK